MSKAPTPSRYRADGGPDDRKADARAVPRADQRAGGGRPRRPSRPPRRQLRQQRRRRHPQTASAGFIVLYIVAGVVFCGLIAMLLAWRGKRSESSTERERQLGYLRDVHGRGELARRRRDDRRRAERGGAGAALADERRPALVPLDEDQPQALREITQVRIGVEAEI